jgi:hypothetical protein
MSVKTNVKVQQRVRRLFGIPVKIYERLRREAEKKGIAVNELVRRILDDWMSSLS